MPHDDVKYVFLFVPFGSFNSIFCSFIEVVFNFNFLLFIWYSSNILSERIILYFFNIARLF